MKNLQVLLTSLLPVVLLQTREPVSKVMLYFALIDRVSKVSGGLININYEIMLLSLPTTNIEIF